MQSFDLNSSTVLNHTPFGSAVQELCEEIVSIPLEKIECGFSDGGCYSLALSMKRLFDHVVPAAPSRIVAVGREDIPVDHAVLECRHPLLGLVYIDSDGMASADLINEKMIFIEQTGTSVIKELPLGGFDSVRSFDEIGLPSALLVELLSSDLPEIISKEFYL